MKIAISAGEESGDILGSDLIDSLRDYKNDIEFISILPTKITSFDGENKVKNIKVYKTACNCK